jgi:hypothetical protein
MNGYFFPSMILALMVQLVAASDIGAGIARALGC